MLIERLIKWLFDQMVVIKWLDPGRAPNFPVTVTGKHGSNYRLSLSCNRKSKKLNLTNLFNSQQ